MTVPTLAPTEIKALARILGDLSYYQLLHLEPQASAHDVKKAYYSSSRAFHPDAYRADEVAVRSAVEAIAKRVREAYSVLRDPRRRPAYDQHLASGGSVRMQLAEATAKAAIQAQQRQGRTPQGRQYFALASADLAREEFGAAVRNLQTALTFEPDNEGFKEALAGAKQKWR